MGFTTAYTSQQPVDDFGLPFSDLNYSANLAITTDTSFTVPGNAPNYKALIKCEPSGHVWVALNATAAVAAGGSFAATTSELLTDKICRQVKAGDVIHFFSVTATTEVSISLYALNTPN